MRRGRRLVNVMEWAKFGQNGGCMASLGVGVCILSRHNKKPRRGANLGEGEAIKHPLCGIRNDLGSLLLVCYYILMD